MSRKSRAGTAADPVTLRATAEERAAWTWAATLDGKTLSDWMRINNNRAAQRAMKKGGK